MAGEDGREREQEIEIEQQGGYALKTKLTLLVKQSNAVTTTTTTEAAPISKTTTDQPRYLTRQGRMTSSLQLISPIYKLQQCKVSR